MNTTDPADYAPLHPGPGLAIGLSLLFARLRAPRAPGRKRPCPGAEAGRPRPVRLVAFARSGWELQDVQRERMPATRPAENAA